MYLGNNRGNEYSQGHIQYDMIADAEDYWRFSWHEMAYDVYANVEAMYGNSTGEKKGFYFGNSQGTIQMNVALVLDEPRLTDKLQRVIQLAPCTVSGQLTEPKLTWYTMNQVGNYQDLGIYYYPTAEDTWEADKQAICDNLNTWNCNRVS